MQYQLGSPQAGSCFMTWLGDRDSKRRKLGEAFLTGNGIEIGALHSPLELPIHTRVQYVDRLTVEQLRIHYPELSARPLVEPSIIDDGEKLSSIDDGSQDFVISSHVIEHMEDPIQVLSTYVRVLRPGGTVFMAVPDKRYTFDARRPVTPFDHLIADHEIGPHVSRLTHFMEWAQFVNGVAGCAAFDNAKAVAAQNYSIHFHVWEPSGFLEFLNRARERYSLPFEIELSLLGDEELTLILRKR
jgi:SAM-dependent methyltransferase